MRLVHIMHIMKCFSDGDEDTTYAPYVTEYDLLVQHINRVDVVYHDDYMDVYAYGEWSPRHTMCCLVHLTPEPELTYWQYAIYEGASIFVSGIATANSETLTSG